MSADKPFTPEQRRWLAALAAAEVERDQYSGVNIMPWLAALNVGFVVYGVLTAMNPIICAASAFAATVSTLAVLVEGFRWCCTHQRGHLCCRHECHGHELTKPKESR